MHLVIECWDPNRHAFDDPVVCVSGGTGEQAIARAFEDAGIETVGCYQVRPEMDPDADPAFYELTMDGKVILRDFPCYLAAPTSSSCRNHFQTRQRRPDAAPDAQVEDRWRDDHGL